MDYTTIVPKIGDTKGGAQNYFFAKYFLFFKNSILPSMQKFELIKKLESLIAFQTDCLAKGDWDSFDKTQDVIKKLEEAIVGSDEKTQANTT